MPTTLPPKIIIIGGGIAGPILAIFLKRHGYNPVIYERQPKSAPEGIALALQPNGLRVLEMIPGLVPKISGCLVDTLQFYSIEPSDPGLLANTSIIAQLVQDGTIPYPWLTVARPHFHAVILAEAQLYGIPVVYDHTLVGWTENNYSTNAGDEDGSVTAYFSNGVTDTASFIVGCDGLHSATRISLFGREKAHFTGMTQMGGHSPKPADKTLWKGMTNIFGDGIHFICYPTSDQTIAWVITQCEGEAKETWKPMDHAGQDEIRNGPYSKLPYGAGELVRTCHQITKYGLYDRPELPTWYRGRVVLLGDAAHPTSPHLGQGANQAFEDAYHLVRLLVKHNAPRGSVPSRFATFNGNNPPALSPTSSTNDEGRSHFVSTPAPAPSIETLTKVFEAYTNKRLARTSALVHGARAQGEIRLVHGPDACIARNNKVRTIWHDQGVMVQGYAAVWKGSFEDDNNNNPPDGEQLKCMWINK